eukprot:382821_1
MTSCEPPENITFYFILQLMFGLFTIVIAIYGAKKLFTIQTLPIVRILFIVTSVLFIISNIGYTSVTASTVFCEQSIYTFAGVYSFNVVATSGTVGYYYGICVVSFFYLIRLKYIFKDTAFIVTNRWYSFGVFCSLFQILLMPFAQYYFWTSNWSPALTILSVITCINVVFSGSILFLYLYKIRTIVSATNKQAYNEDDELVSYAVKYCILAFVSLTSTNIANIITIYRIEVRDTKDLFIFHIAYIGIDCFINLLCFFMQFKFGLNTYNKCCKCVHNAAMNFILRSMDKQLIGTPNVSIQSKSSTNIEMH